MAQLFPKSSKKADNAMSDAERAHRERVAEVHQQVSKGLFNGTPPRTAGSESVFGGVGLANLDQSTKTATKADAAPALHPAVAALQLTRTLAAKSAETLSMIVTAHEHTKGDAVEFTHDELSHALRVSTKDAGDIVGQLQRAGLIVQRTNGLGGPAGYAPTLPR